MKKFFFSLALILIGMQSNASEQFGTCKDKINDKKLITYEETEELEYFTFNKEMDNNKKSLTAEVFDAYGMRIYSVYRPFSHFSVTSAIGISIKELLGNSYFYRKSNGGLELISLCETYTPKTKVFYYSVGVVEGFFLDKTFHIP